MATLGLTAAAIYGISERDRLGSTAHLQPDITPTPTPVPFSCLVSDAYFISPTSGYAKKLPIPGIKLVMIG